MENEDITTEKLRAAAIRVAASVMADDLADRPLEVILEQLLITHAPQPIVIDVADRYYEHDGSRFELKYPFRGDLKLLIEVSEMVSRGQSTGGQSVAEFAFNVDHQLGEDFADQLAQLVTKIEEKLLEDVRTANEIIGQRQAVFAETLRAELQPRWKMTRALRGAMEQLQVPLTRPTSGRVEVPVRPAPLSMRVLEEAAATGAPQWALADDMAESVVQTIASFSKALERLPGTTKKLLEQDEETLRDVLLFVLNANFQGQVTGETFIGQGKSDLLLRWKDRDAFVGECKIWKGPQALTAGLEQLLTRYTLWRQSRIALIVFMRGHRNVTDLIDSAHAAISAHPRTQRLIDASEPASRGDYEVLASDDEKRLAHLTFLPVVID
ncbi:hypothetical protein GMA12_17850 [Kocuria sediminis]|uniref:Uncharacterized protein n=1 Tax=Kocuria sediminis TaxID=1038857 RepID=A0A6N8GUJ2_9MICC|nr:hypothetical protein [Kocuria sediminis]MUN64656.1 hypothetical protein [Kocuria sediminis]MUN64983.1 hypothetical protein [Kocuria sediminis]